MRNITRIRVTYMYESCERHNYYVELTTDEGFTKTPDGHRSGSIYTNFEGLTREEARDRALTDAACWGDFLEMPVEPYVEDGIQYEPEFALETYTTRRILKARRETH